MPDDRLTQLSEDRRSDMPSVLVYAFLAVCLINYNPYPGIAIVVILFCVWVARALVFRLSTLAVILLANYAYWIVSAVAFSRLSLSYLLSLGFLRWDGRIFFYYVPFLFFSSFVLNARRTWRYASVLGAIAAGLILVALAQHVTGIHVPGLPRMIRSEYDQNVRYPFFFGLHRTHNAAGTAYGLIALVFVILVASWRSMPLRRLFAALTGVLLVGLVLTLSREAFVAFTAGLLTWALLERQVGLRRALRLLAAVAVIVGITAAIDRPFMERWFTLGPSAHNVAARLNQQGPSVDEFQASPLFGVGFGRWNDIWCAKVPGAKQPSSTCARGGAAATVAPPRLDYAAGTGHPGVVWFATGYAPIATDDTPHNSYLLLLSELGILGLLLMLAFWLAYLYRVHVDARRAPRGSFEHAYLAAARACGVFVLVDSFFGHGMAAPSLGLVFSFFAGTALALVPGRGMVPRGSGLQVPVQPVHGARQWEAPV
jgi:O-antigen ligase